MVVRGVASGPRRGDAPTGFGRGVVAMELAGLFVPPGPLDSPVQLLRADAAVVPFRGRSRLQLLEELVDWCTDASSSDIALDKPVASARSTSNRAPAWPTTPRPSALTTILGRQEERFTLRVPLHLDRRNLRQVRSSQVEGHFYVCGTLSPARLLKGPG